MSISRTHPKNTFFVIAKSFSGASLENPQTGVRLIFLSFFSLLVWKLYQTAIRLCHQIDEATRLIDL